MPGDTLVTLELLEKQLNTLVTNLPNMVKEDHRQKLKIKCLELATQAKAASDADTDTLTKAKSYYEWLNPSTETLTKE